MSVIKFRMNSGIPGNINRAQHCTVEPGLIDTTTGHTPQAYGLPLVIDATTNKYRQVIAGDAALAVVGFNVRPYPTMGGQTGNPGDALGVSTPSQAGIVNVLKRGYIHVLLGGTTAAIKGGLLYIRIAAAATGKPIGGIEAAADGANTIVLPASSYFMGPADALGNTEIAYNI